MLSLTAGLQPNRESAGESPRLRPKQLSSGAAGGSHTDREAAQHLATRGKLGSSQKFISPVVGDWKGVKAEKGNEKVTLAQSICQIVSAQVNGRGM